ncbi:hypothetical protein [Ferrimonas marina]|uniref:Uncharacterized protein n=1 Tax=Ferrimonas marina TaxID=299255 RepID=A0A1M5UEK4_9GAMM|nr:hypothetical protein [Ferrimonas marina]SHH61266.1 hypothetical protein SAMN02745129_2525 [Ferrimonas marina]
MKIKANFIILGAILALLAGVAVGKQWHPGVVKNASSISTTPLVSEEVDTTPPAPSYPNSPTVSLSCSPSCNPSSSSIGSTARTSLDLRASGSCPYGSCTYTWSYGSMGTGSGSSTQKAWTVSSSNGTAKKSGTVRVTVKDNTSGKTASASKSVSATAIYQAWTPDTQTNYFNCPYPQNTCITGIEKRTEISPGKWGSWVTTRSPSCVAENRMCF